MDPRLKQEIDILTEIYCDELELRPSQNFVKLRVKCLPLLEDRNIEHHYEFDHPFLFANIDVPNEYPDDSPKFYLESTHSKIAIGTSLAELTIRVENLAKTMQGDPCIVDMIEYIRVTLALTVMAIQRRCEEKQALQEAQTPHERRPFLLLLRR